MSRTHVAVHVWVFCGQCGIHAPTNCQPCVEVHERLHHRKRRHRIRKETVA